jgi:group II intron reverse transcriptase/maturase
MALEQIWHRIMRTMGAWVIEADIRDFFGTLKHSQLRGFLDQRVRDGVLRRTIDKWLSAGVMEDGNLEFPDDGTPQGGVISPLLANVYLHEVLDKWLEETVKPRLKGSVELIRFADDFVCIFELEEDAHRVMDVLPKRFEKYGLTLHPDKTRLVNFSKPTGKKTQRRYANPRAFDFLGLHHTWGLSRKNRWCVKQLTSGSRLRRACAAITEWCRDNRHEPQLLQRQKLVKKVRGHYVYYGVTGNARALNRYYRAVTRIWFKWLNRRSQKRSTTWERFVQYLNRYPLPKPRMYASALLS